MTEHIIQEWLADYAALSPDELHTFASTIHHNTEVINAVFAVLDDRQKYSELVDPVCTILFGFYRSKEIELKRFTLVFLPTLIYVYLNAVAHGEKKSCRGVEALLVGLYNLEAVDDNCEAQNISFRLPSLAQASLYHEPMSLAPLSLTESALRRLEECNTKLVRWGPLTQVEKIIAQNRLVVMTALLFIYNQHISCLQKYSLDQLCKVVSKLVTQGFNKPGKRVSYSSDVPRVLPRIPVSQKFLLEILYSLYYSIFNGDVILALQAVEEVHQRACYQGYSDVMLVTNAIKNATPPAHSGQITDNPMGISLAISPSTATTVVSKSMITNASFRTKKLPDDIPIQVGRGEGDSSGLGSISEEREDGTNIAGANVGENTANPGGGGGVGSGQARRSLPKMAVNFGKKTRERLSKGRSLSSAGQQQQQLQQQQQQPTQQTGQQRGSTVNGNDSWDGDSNEVQENDSGMGDSVPSEPPPNGTAHHDHDTRTMQVSSV
uniref:Putative beta-catenin-tcf/lef signaling pathway component drctnnb1a n=1 Tax=Panstrongylus megistus TaxID=65343 RepID=A0A069DV98_9HEMI